MLNIKKYIKASTTNNYRKFYKLLNNDFTIIRNALNENLILDKDETYFNFLISFWVNLKKFRSKSSLDFYISEYLNSKPGFKLDIPAKNCIKDTDTSKAICLKINTYIHKKLLLRLLFEDVKSKYNIKEANVESEFFLSNHWSAAVPLIEQLNYDSLAITPTYDSRKFSFCIFLLTTNGIIFKPLTNDYQSVYDNNSNPIYSITNLKNISKVIFKPRFIEFTLENLETFKIGPLCNISFYNFSDQLQDFFIKKEINFKVLEPTKDFSPIFKKDNLL